MNSLDEIRRSLFEIEEAIPAHDDDEDFQALLFEIVEIGERFLIHQAIHRSLKEETDRATSN